MAKSIKPTEAQILKAILDYLLLRGIFAWRTNSAAMQAEYKGKSRFFRAHSINGVSDILGIVPYWALRDGEIVRCRPEDVEIGRFLAIEVKSEKGKLSLAQKSFLDAVKANGGIAIVARSVDGVVKALG